MSNPALLIVDVQQGLDDPSWGRRNNPDAEVHVAQLLADWRKRDWPIVHVRHSSMSKKSPLHVDGDGFAFKSEAQPLDGETVFTKQVNSAFIGTELGGYLREQGISSLVLVGLTTDHCVSTTARMAGNLGFDVTLVADATATFDRPDGNGGMLPAEQVHAVHLASLDGEFCRVLTVKQLALEMG